MSPSRMGFSTWGILSLFSPRFVVATPVRERGAVVDVIHARSCGLDVHKKSVVACVLTTHADGTVVRTMRTFTTMTADLLEMAKWLDGLDVTHIAMESTGAHRGRSGFLWCPAV